MNGLKPILISVHDHNDVWMTLYHAKNHKESEIILAELNFNFNADILSMNRAEAKKKKMKLELGKEERRNGLSYKLTLIFYSFFSVKFAILLLFC